MKIAAFFQGGDSLLYNSKKRFNAQKGGLSRYSAQHMLPCSSQSLSAKKHSTRTF